MARPIPEPRRQLNCRIPTELWERVNNARIQAGMSRDAWLTATLTDVLAHDEWATLAEQGRQLASQREDLIAAGADPTELLIPLYPGTP